MNNNIKADRPFGDFMDEFFNRSISDIVGADFTQETPSVNIVELEDSYELNVAAPGMKKNDFSISIDKDQLIISGEKKDYDENRIKNTYKRKEFDYEEFSRKFRLPKAIDKNSISANYKLGILKINIKKLIVQENDKIVSIEIT